MTVRERQFKEACRRFLDGAPLQERDERALPMALLQERQSLLDVRNATDHALGTYAALLRRIIEAEEHLSTFRMNAEEEVRERMRDRERRLIAEFESRRQHLLSDLEDERKREVNGVRDEQQQIAWLTVRAICDRGNWPHPPMCGTIEPTADGDGLPNSSGIYFVWDGSLWAYVGKSICLRKRATARHSSISLSDRIAFIEFPPESLNFAECLYIGLCKPYLNFTSEKERRQRKGAAGAALES